MFKGTSTQSDTVATLAVSMALSLLAGCASTVPTVSSLGKSAEGRSYDRTIRIGLSTRFVNVDSGEVIKFVVQEPDGAAKSFTWTFARAREAVGELGQLAPVGVLDRPVKVIVGPNPLY
jgi:hypothetical protein